MANARGSHPGHSGCPSRPGHPAGHAPDEGDEDLGGPIVSNGAGPLNDYTVPSPLPTFTYAQIIQALRTSRANEATATPAANDHVTDQRTFSWGTAGDIVYEVDTTTMSTFERGRIDLAFEVWDDLINVNIRNDQTSGDPGGPTRFASVSFVSAGTNAGNAFFSIDTITANANVNGYGTTDNTINTGTFSLGRTFSAGEFDGRDASGNLDNGVFDLTLFARRGFETMLHEAGHGLGLSHPGFYNNGHVSIAAGVRFDQDNRRNTIMSYRTEDAGADSNADWNGLFAATPMIYDIAAVQTMYGADPNTRTGATTYGFNNTSGRPVFDFSTTLGSVFAIYDASGNDTIDASAFSSDSVINLWPGTYSSIGLSGGNTGDRMVENVGIAFNTIIENAIGGSGNDVLWGNDDNNILDQRLGGGEMRGFGGQDIMIAGNGAEQFDGGDGWDTLDYSRSTDGVDIVFGKVGGGWGFGDSFVNVEKIIATAFDDTANMGGGDDTVEGLGGNDVLIGNGGIDGLYGGAGNDILKGGEGAWVGDLFFLGDWLDGGEGWDIAAFDHAVTIDLRPGGVNGGEAREDTFVSIEQFNGSAESDVFYGNDLNNWFQGGAEGDYINGGGGSDTASYADRNSGITAQMSFNNFAAGDEFRSPNEIAGRTDGKVSPADGTWIDTLISIENIEGTNFDDVFLGDERANTFWGLAGDDRFEGDDSSTPQGSWDDMYGGAGNDTFTVGINDLADGGTGNDVATFVGGALFLDFNTFTFSIGGTAIHVRDIETYIGTDFSDRVVGAGYGETINLGAGGQDYADGQGGDDFLYTSDGFDTLIGGAGFDTIVFHRSMMASWQTGELDAAIAETWQSWEAIQGAGGVDVIRTNDWGFAVELRGGGGNDILASGPNQFISDTLKGEAGDDALDGGAGADLMAGGTGNDSYVVDNAGDVVVEAAGGGFDTVRTSVSLVLGGEIEQLLAADPAALAALSLVGNAAAQTIAGNAGDNLLDGGAGTDTVSYADAGGGVTVSLAKELQDTGNAGTDTIRNFENVIGSAFADRLTGNTGGNTLDGSGGADTLIGLAGNDRYLVDSARDRVVEAADEGNDLVLAASSFTLAAGASVERLVAADPAAVVTLTLTGNALVQTLEGNAGANTLDGKGGADTMSGFGGNDRYYVDDALDRVIEAAGGGTDTVLTSVSYALASNAAIELLSTTSAIGTAAIDLTGNSLAQTLEGNAGANTLDGRGGADTMSGFGGNDRYFVDDALDRVMEAAGGGSDEVLASVSYALAANAAVERLATTSAAGRGALDLTGNALAQTLEGNAGGNTLDGKGGADTMSGLGGNDRYLVDDALDRVIEAAGGGSDEVLTSVGYRLAAAAEVERLATVNAAGASDLDLTGNGFAQAVEGNKGDNVLDGGGGNDTLRGFAGRDTFAFTSVLGAGNVDTIVDFNVAADTIRLENAVFAGLATGLLSAAAFFQGSRAHDADDRIVYNATSGALSFDADGNGAGAAVRFATLGAGLALTNADFQVV